MLNEEIMFVCLDWDQSSKKLMIWPLPIRAYTYIGDSKSKILRKILPNPIPFQLSSKIFFNFRKKLILSTKVLFVVTSEKSEVIWIKEVGPMPGITMDIHHFTNL